MEDEDLMFDIPSGSGNREIVVVSPFDVDIPFLVKMRREGLELIRFPIDVRNPELSRVVE